ncbi:MAG: DoxX family protein [Hyphomonadaceae bacterium]|jgi:putative oxidoreductase|nr:DoxX family protein [Hyphomonadaceae bacterium]
MQSTGLTNAAALLGRLLLAAVFIQAGWGKIGGYEGTVAYMTKFGVPGMLAPAVIAVELLGGLLIVIGWQTRLVAVGMAIFTLLAAYFFHTNFGDRNQAIHFMKNLAIAGGFLALAAGGPGAWSVDGRREA